MVAAENGALKGAKVGGMADVIRDLPPALADVGVISDVIMPSYGFLVSQHQALWLQTLSVDFAGQRHCVDLYRLSHPSQNNDEPSDKGHIYLLEHGLFQNPHLSIYTDGSADRPFAEDATKFAFFCVCVATALVTNALPPPGVLHLHDWHTGLLAMLRAMLPQFQSLKELTCVFTVHNLALQGIRPLSHEASSLAAWFPQLLDNLSADELKLICDPRYPECINPMLMGIALSDRVHLVSPSYAEEVLLPSRPEQGFFGGEGLEGFLQDKASRGDVVGILNGCFYPGTTKGSVARVPCASSGKAADKLTDILHQAETALLSWQANTSWVKASDLLALTRIHQRLRLSEQANSPFIVTSVGRLTNQKVLILRQRLADGKTVLEHLLTVFAAQAPDGILVLLGSGDALIAQECQQLAAKWGNFLFLNGYHDGLSEALYRNGDLFLMPSSFEPCGISQMLAMRAGQPCLVHGVGGLKDTVKHGETGFVFTGDTLTAQGEQLISTFELALTKLHLSSSEVEQQKMATAAKTLRFSWRDVALDYLDKLYRF